LNETGCRERRKDRWREDREFNWSGEKIDAKWERKIEDLSGNTCERNGIILRMG
jgi:hypothetical protein